MSIDLRDIKKLLTLYELKREIRYHHTRDEEKAHYTESVAEHVYGMMIVADYFLPLLDPDRKWDRQKINSMILYHDIDEIITGDTIGYLKSTEHKAIELEAVSKVVERLPNHMQATVTSLMREYFEQSTPEAQFVKAVDKFEPLLQCWNESGKTIMHHYKTSLEQHWSVKRDALGKFPLLMEYAKAITADWIEQGFFADETTSASEEV